VFIFAIEKNTILCLSLLATPCFFILLVQIVILHVIILIWFVLKTMFLAHAQIRLDIIFNKGRIFGKIWTFDGFIKLLAALYYNRHRMTRVENIKSSNWFSSCTKSRPMKPEMNKIYCNSKINICILLAQLRQRLHE
jgi:hypothetical protein